MTTACRRIPLFIGAEPGRPVAFREGRVVTLAELMDGVGRYAASLPAGHGFLVNLCEDRYLFLVAYCAAVARGWTNLLPSARAPEVVAEVVAA